jgi:hypothetical protein
MIIMYIYVVVLPYLTEAPQSKSRLVGENVTLCCKAVASPAIVNYEWYYNYIYYVMTYFP